MKYFQEEIYLQRRGGPLNLPRRCRLRKRSQSPPRKAASDWNPEASKASESETLDTAVHFSVSKGMEEKERHPWFVQKGEDLCKVERQKGRKPEEERVAPKALQNESNAFAIPSLALDRVDSLLIAITFHCHLAAFFHGQGQVEGNPQIPFVSSRRIVILSGSSFVQL